MTWQFHFLFDYIRIICYALVILTDLRNIVNRKFDTLLFLGDVILAFALMVSALNITTTGFNQELVIDRIGTPAAIIWASIHFYEFLKKSDNTKD
jgi:hypothetical protein